MSITGVKGFKMNTKISIQTLESSEDIREVKGILYDTYIAELGWKPWLENNQSNISILADADGMYMEDDFGQHCEWHGIIVNKKICGVFRSISFENIELRRYLSSSLIDGLPNTPFEYNRCAVLPEYRSLRGMISAIGNFTIEHSLERKCGSIIGTGHPALTGTFLRQGYQSIKTFKYNTFDENEISLLVHSNNLV